MRKIHYLLIPLFYLLVGGAGCWYTMQGLAVWYPALAKPAHAPAPWFFLLVWPSLFLLAAWSFFLFVDRARGRASFGVGVRLYIMNGVLGAAWCYLFFVRHLLGLAVLAAALLAGSVVLIIIFARPYSFRATLLLLPYFLWSAVLTSLANEIFLLNR